MAFQAVPDTARVQFNLEGTSGGNIPGLPWFFNFHVRDTVVGWTSTNLTALLDYAKGWWDSGKGGNGSGRALTHTGWTVKNIEVRDLGSEFGLFTSGLPTNPQGTRAGDLAPPSCPAVVQFIGDLGGAPKRGRIFWSGLSEADLQADEWVSAARTSLTDCINGFVGELSDPTEGGSVDWAFVLVSRNVGTEPDPTPPRIAVRRAEAVTNTLGPPATVRAIVGAQRNRRPTP